MADTLFRIVTREIQNVAERFFPAWISEGVPDYLCTIHSFGVTFWTTLGQSLDLVAVGEMPAPQQETTGYAGGDVISDSVWFSESILAPRAIVEFERYNSSCPRRMTIAGN